MIKFIVFIGIILLNSSCFGLSKKEKEILIGEWYSNKEVTFDFIHSEQLKFELLSSKLGKTSYVFKPSFTTFGNVNADYKEQLVWRVKNISQDEISIYVGHNYINTLLVKFVTI